MSFLPRVPASPRPRVPTSPRPRVPASPRPRVPASPSRRGGFTLVEVMIAIAIALVLILGIAQIFSMAQRTTGAGMQVLADTDMNRGIQQQLLNDARGVTNAVGDSPGLVILSYPQAAFRSRADQQQDLDTKPETLNDPVNSGNSLPAETISTIDDRIHRTDVLGFFSRGKFTRRTGDPGLPPQASLTSPTTSDEAFIWYGHLALPDNDAIKNWKWDKPSQPTPTGYFWNPGSATVKQNPNNFFASDWILGRQVILLAPRPASSPEPHIVGTSAPANPLWLPVYNNNPSQTIDRIPLCSSRYDLADGSIASFRQFFPIPPPPPPPGKPATQWWLGWQGLSGWDLTKGAAQVQQTRFYANPFARKPNLTLGPGTETEQLSAALAQMSPIFVRGCTQFIVEFAGDFVTQDATKSGQITAAGPDGQIDYVNVPDPSNPGQFTQQIRWYGFPRDTARNPNTVGGGPTLTDGGVLPVSYVLAHSTPPILASAAGHMLDFERSVPTLTGLPNTWKTWNRQNSQGNTAANTATGTWPAVYPQTDGNTLTPYACAWGPDTDEFSVPRPKMLRITIAVDDPTGHLNTQQIYEYVINLP